MLSASVWQDIFSTQREHIARVAELVLNPARFALPERIAQVLDIPATVVVRTHARDARPWSRRLLEHHADIERGAREIEAYDDALCLALLAPAQQRHLAVHLGALRLRMPLRRLVSRDALAPFTSRGLLDAVRFAQRHVSEPHSALPDAHDWHALRLARLVEPLGLAYLQRAQIAISPRLAWRWQLRHGRAPNRDTALAPHEALRMCAVVARQLGEMKWTS